MKTIALLSAILMLGFGCGPAAPAPRPPAANANVPRANVNVPPSQPGHPPVVVMTVGDETYPGVEGSYCWQGTCADKIAPPQLVTEAGLGFKAATSTFQARFAVGGEVFEFFTGILDASGTQLDVRIPTGYSRDDGRYTATLPTVRGPHYIMAQVRFGASGGDDVTYYFPVDMR